MLRCDNLTLTQGAFSLRADLTIDAPVNALLGPSGAGKSTLLNAIAGFVTPQQGRVLWQDQDITRLPPAKRPVAMLFQDNNLFPHLSVQQNLALALTTGRPDDAMGQQIAQVLEQVDLHNMQDRKPSALSGGQQARVALARALLQQRPLLLLDEPFAALGPALKHDMLQLVQDVARDKALQVIMVSHAPDDARLIAQAACVVGDGEVTPPQTTGPLLESPPRALARYLGRR